MKNQFNEETANKLAGLQIDMLSKFRAGQISLQEFEIFLNMKPAKRKQVFGISPWADQMVAISKFYKEEFGIDIDWSNIALPGYSDERPRLELCLTSLSCKEMVQKYHVRFGNLASNDYSQDPDSAIHTQQERPKLVWYTFAWAGTVEPDLEHRNKSYNMFKNDGNTYMVPREGIIAAYRYRCETGDMLDVKGLTRFHATGSDGGVLLMDRFDGGRFHIGSGLPDSQDSDFGPRQVNLS